MNSKKVLAKLEDKLSEFLIQEICKADPKMRSSSEIYKYKGLNINADGDTKNFTKTVKIRIGILEAEFNLSSLEKVSGSLSAREERLIQIWMSKKENGVFLRKIFSTNRGIRTVTIIPFDMEDYYRGA